MLTNLKNCLKLTKDLLVSSLDHLKESAELSKVRKEFDILLEKVKSLKSSPQPKKKAAAKRKNV